VDATHVDVVAKDGVVTLSGHVASHANKLAAERTVRRVRGVKAIAQEIEVHLPSEHQTGDDEIASRALKILAWNASVPRDAVTVRVEKGWMTLSGTVDWQFQRDAAERAVRKLNGIKGVSNVLSVRPRVQPSDIRHRTEQALRRDAELDAARVTISVDGSPVVLGGRVQNWHEREAAERAAWAAPGGNAGGGPHLDCLMVPGLRKQDMGMDSLKAVRASSCPRKPAQPDRYSCEHSEPWERKSADEAKVLGRANCLSASSG